MELLRDLYYFTIKIRFFIAMVYRKYNKDNKYAKLLKWKNKYKGKRCFIIGTGPSLNVKDLDKLIDEYTFSMNSIVLSYPETKWRPTFYCIQDGRAYNVLMDKILELKKEIVFLGNSLRRNSVNYCDIPVDMRRKMVTFPLYDQKKLSEIKFSDNAYKIIYDGRTITYSILQLAVYMGFEEIYLLGIDCDYTSTKKKNIVDYVDNTNGVETENAMLYSYKIADLYCKDNGIKIYNASPKGKLMLFPRVNLDEVLRK